MIHEQESSETLFDREREREMTEPRRIRVVVGSLNPGKIEAARMAFVPWFVNVDGGAVAIDVSGVRTESGVPDQPVGLDQTIRGARNRAAAIADAHARTSASPSAKGTSFYAVGLESGVVIIDGAVFDVCACAIASTTVIDHAEQQPQCFIACSPMFPLPPAVAAAFLDASNAATHLQYNEAFATLVDPDADGGGVLAAMSGGRLGRPWQMTSAVQLALMQATSEEKFGYAARCGGRS